MASQLLDGRFRGETDEGLPLVGGMLYTYASGTTTPKAAYTEATLATPTTNPVTLNARGEAQVWLGAGVYSLKLTDSAGVMIWTVDGVSASDAQGAGQAAADALRADLASALAGKGAALVGIEDAGGYLAGLTVESALQWLAGTGRGYLLVTQFADLVTAHNAATAASVPLWFPPGVHNAGINSFSIDLTRTEWRDMGGASVQWSGTPTLFYGVRLVGTSTYTDTYKQARELRFPNLLGASSSAGNFVGTAMQIGDGIQYTQSLDIRVNIQGFAGCVYYRDNTWWITLRGRFMWGTISTDPAATNHGEALVFDACTFGDGCSITLNHGDATFIGGSLDNSTLTANGAMQIAWYRPHIENPGSTTAAPLMIDVAGIEALVKLHDVHLIFNDPDGAGATNITDAPFRVSASNTVAGLEIDGIQYSQGPIMNFMVSDDYIALVRSGGGRSIVNGAKPRAFSNSYFVIGSDRCNLLANGGFEAGSLGPWQSTGTAVQDSTQHITGKRIASAKSAKLSVTAASGYAQIAQTVRCATGDFVTLQIWVKGDGAAGHDGQVKVDFLDGQGGSIAGSAGAGAVVSSGATWTLLRLAAFAPAGAQYVYITLNCSRSSSDGSVYYDEAVLNVG